MIKPAVKVIAAAASATMAETLKKISTDVGKAAAGTIIGGVLVSSIKRAQKREKKWKWW